MNIDFDQIQSAGLPNFNFGNAPLAFIVSALLTFIFPAAGILVLIYLLWGGLQLMISGGDPKAVQSAKEKITGALIGFVIIFAAYWIVQILGSFLGVDRLIEAF